MRRSSGENLTVITAPQLSYFNELSSRFPVENDQMLAVKLLGLLAIFIESHFTSATCLESDHYFAVLRVLDLPNCHLLQTIH